MMTQLERHYDINGDGCQDLEWTVDREARHITLRWTSAAGADWTAFALSENGGMKGADYMIVKKNTNSGGSFEVQDRVSTDYALPELDVLQNVELLSAVVDEQDRLQVVVRRDLQTCDRQDIAVQSHKQYVLCASGPLTEQGEIAYHGPNNRASGSVYFMVDEEALFELDYETPQLNNISTTVLQAGLTIRGDMESQTSPFPVDIQMTNVTLDPNIPTHYRCKVFTLDTDMRASAFEAAWDDGKTPSAKDGAATHDVLHHADLSLCQDTNLLDPQYLQGQVWDCAAKMPACDIKMGVARGTGLAQAPAGLHFPLRQGIYVLVVHYENPKAQPVVNDRSGLRLWIEPPALPSRTAPAQVVVHNALLESIHIPANPQQQQQQSSQVELSYLISATATQEYLPPSGVQIFASMLHMHELGVQGRVQLIRNGTHILDVYDTLSYDFSRQTPHWSRWRMLPGDALIVTCVYQPDASRDVRGGLSTKDEMCDYILAWTPEIPNYGRPAGIMVQPGEPFGNTHMGNNKSYHTFELPYSEYEYPPIPKHINDFVPLKQHRYNVCGVLIADELNMQELSYSDPAIAVQFTLIVAFFWTRLFSLKRVTKTVGVDHDDLRGKRNFVVYIGELVFSMVALPFVILTLVETFPNDPTYDAVDPDTYQLARGLINTQTFLYLLELFYRVEVRVSLMGHHLMTSVTVIFLNLVLSSTYTRMALTYGLILILLAMTEQPLYIILLLRLMRYCERHPTVWPKLCHGAATIFLLSRVVVIALLIVAMTQSSSLEDPAWRVSQESFVKWWDRSMTFTPALVTSVVAILASGILLSNYFAWAALNHMAKKIHNKEPATVGDLSSSSKHLEQEIPKRSSEETNSNSSGGLLLRVRRRRNAFVHQLSIKETGEGAAAPTELLEPEAIPRRRRSTLESVLEGVSKRMSWVGDEIENYE